MPIVRVSPLAKRLALACATVLVAACKRDGDAAGLLAADAGPAAALTLTSATDDGVDPPSDLPALPRDT